MNAALIKNHCARLIGWVYLARASATTQDSDKQVTAAWFLGSRKRRKMNESSIEARAANSNFFATRKQHFHLLHTTQHLLKSASYYLRFLPRKPNELRAGG
jgi:hypothetical protein